MNIVMWYEILHYSVPMFLLFQSYPEFGSFLKVKQKKIAAYKKSAGPLKHHIPEAHRPVFKLSGDVPRISAGNGQHFFLINGI